MTMIKNVHKYGNNIKFAKGVLLDVNKRLNRVGDYGISTKNFSNYWFLTEGQSVLFKKSLSDVMALNEIVCYKLCQKMSISCAKYDRAELSNRQIVNDEVEYGVASYNFLQPDEKLISLAQFLPEMLGVDFERTYLNIVKLLKKVCKQRKDKIDFEQIACGLFEMTLFDIVTFQTDRHTHNVSFIVDKDSNIRLAPLYDNECAFLENWRRYYYDKFDTIDEFIDNYFCDNGFLPPMKIPMQSSDRGSMSKITGLALFNTLATQIAELAKSSPKLDRIFKNVINNLNLDDIFIELEQNGYVLEEGYKNFTRELVGFAKRKMIKAYNQTKTSEDQNCK